MTIISEGDLENDRAHCKDQVELFDNDRFLATYFAPSENQSDLFALYAFNLEVAKTAEVVSEAMIGHIRLQWWRDAVEEIYGGRERRHAVVQPLAQAIRSHQLEQRLFEGLIEAREFDLEGRQPRNLAELEDYAVATSGNLNELALQILGEANPEVFQAGRRLGVAWALVGLLRAVPFYARHKRCIIPMDLSTECKLVLGDLFELRESPALAAAVEPIWTKAHDHLRTARQLRRSKAKPGQAVLLLAKFCRLYLERLEKANMNPFDPLVQNPIPGRAWRLVASKLLGR